MVLHKTDPAVSNLTLHFGSQWVEFDEIKFARKHTRFTVRDLPEFPKRTEALHGLLDTHVGLALPS